MRRALLLGWILVLVVATAALAAGPQRLGLTTLSSGGGRSVSGDSVLVGSIGQPLVGRLGSGSSQLCAGYPECRLPEVSVAAASALEGDSGSATASFTVSLSYATAQTVTVGYATADGSATSSSDYLTASGSLTFTAGLTETTIPVTVYGDTTFEGDETFTVTLVSPVHATLGNAQATGTILDDDPLPSISVKDAATPEGNSGAKEASFVVTLSNATVQTVAVEYLTADGTATAGSDYLAASGTITFTPGLTEAAIPVTLYGDTIYEGDESFLIILSAPANATLSDAQATGTILDDDPVPSITLTGSSTAEGDTGTTEASFAIVLSNATVQTVTVDYATADGTATADSDYLAASGTVTFTPGVTETAVAVTVYGDTTYEGEETFTFSLSNPVHAILGDVQATGTILDDDPVPGISVADASTVEGDAGTVGASFAVTLSNATVQMVTVTYATADGTAMAGSDYLATSGTITFTPGLTATTIPVPVYGESIFEGDETFSLTLSNPVHATLADAQATGTILNDDPVPSLSVTGSASPEGDVGSVETLFEVALSNATVQTITVQYATSDGTATAGSDYLAASGTLTFTPGLTEATIPVTVYGDTVYEGDEELTVSLSAPVHATLGEEQARGTILNDDPLPTVGFQRADYAVDESAGTAIITVTLSSQSAYTCSVGFETRDGTATGSEAGGGGDYGPVSGTLTFLPGERSQSFGIQIYDDARDELDETVHLLLYDPVSATLPGAVEPAVITSTLTLLDDEGSPGLRINDVSAREDEGKMTFVVQLSFLSELTVTVDYATEDADVDGAAAAGADYVAAGGTLTLPPGSSQGEVAVPILQDNIYEGDERLALVLSNPSQAQLSRSQAVGTILDDDPVPSLSVADKAILEGDAGTTEAPLMVVISNATVQTITVDYGTADGTAIAGSDYLAASGTLTFTPGMTETTIPVSIYGDTIYEGDETFTVTLTSPVHATVSDGQAIGTILDDDALPSISLSDVEILEGDDGTAEASFVATLSNAAAHTVTVDYATADGTATAGTDYLAASGSITFTPGLTGTLVIVHILGDTEPELDETFLVRLSNPVFATLADGEAVGTILNDETGKYRIFLPMVVR
jgi:hypothetical protein